MTLLRSIQMLAVCALLTMGLAGLTSAFAGDTEGKEGGDACCQNKADGHVQTAGMDLAPCEDGDTEEAIEARPAGWPTVGVVSDQGFYPVNTCAVTGETLDPSSKKLHTFDYEGRLIVTCCPGCESRFKAEPERFIQNLDAMIIAQQGPVYPLTTCPTSGEELGGMGAPIEMIADNYLVRFCCAGCQAPFAKDPSETIAKLEAYYSAPIDADASTVTDVANAN